MAKVEPEEGGIPVSTIRPSTPPSRRLAENPGAAFVDAVAGIPSGRGASVLLRGGAGMRVHLRKSWRGRALMTQAEQNRAATALNELYAAGLKKKVRATPGLEGHEYGLMGIKQFELMAKALRMSKRRLWVFMSEYEPRESYAFARRVAKYAGVSLGTLLHVPAELWIDRAQRRRPPKWSRKQLRR